MTSTSNQLAASLFSPQTIALIGASADPTKNSGRAQRYLRRHGFQGRIALINPERPDIDGERCYSSLSDVDGLIDHAFILTGTSRVEDALRACAARSVPVATVLASGYAEAGEGGIEREKKLLEIAREGGMRLLGPNSMGFINVYARTAMCVNAALDTDTLLPGNIGLVSQSGSMLGTMLSRGQARGIGFSKLISVGNEADLSTGELADLLVDDTDTKAILLFLESIRDADSIRRMAQRAHAASKPVIAYKLGRSEVGGALAVSHTGAIAGSDECIGAFLRQCGIARAEMLESLLELPYLLMQGPPLAIGRKNASVVTTTGGGGAMVVDQLALRDINIVKPAQGTRERLRERGIEVSDSALIDLTLAGTTKHHAEAALEELLHADESDVIVSVIGSSAQFKPQLALAGILAAHKSRCGGKALGVFLAPHADASLQLLAEEGIAGFRTPETAADCVRAYLEWSPLETPDSNLPVQSDALHEMLSDLDEGAISPDLAMATLACMGIPVVRSSILRDVYTFKDLPEDIHYPLALKIVSPNIQHKTEAGGVVLNVQSRGDLELSVARMIESVSRYAPAAKIQGIEVQTMEKGLAEAVLGFRHDPQVGPIVLLGAGGVLTEIYKDFSVRMAPVTRSVALKMIQEVKGLAHIRGYRNLPKGDVPALADAIVAMSSLAATSSPKVIEAEVNPLVIRREGEGVVAVDALLSISKAS
jgi:acetate---CoA ligase (ADP-forming)